MASCYKLDLMTGEYTFDQHLFNARFYSGPLYTGQGILFTGFLIVLLHRFVSIYHK